MIQNMNKGNNKWKSIMCLENLLFISAPCLSSINKSHTISWLLESCYNKGILMGHIVKER